MLTQMVKHYLSFDAAHGPDGTFNVCELLQDPRLER